MFSVLGCGWEELFSHFMEMGCYDKVLFDLASADGELTKSQFIDAAFLHQFDSLRSNLSTFKIGVEHVSDALSGFTQPHIIFQIEIRKLETDKTSINESFHE